ncbi:MAG: hypothetical protein ACI4UY_03315 [Kiritimatiellia bacterium]
MNKLRKSILLTILALFLPMAQAWAGGSTTTYYAALKAQVSSQSSGMGTVYAGTTKTAGTYDTASTSSADSENKGEEKTFYAFAKANDGYAFKGWSTLDNGTDLGTASPISQTVKCSSDSSDKPTTTTLYATFAEKVLPPFDILFQTGADGIYTVNGEAPANLSGLTRATKVTLASADAAFFAWTIDGSKVYDNPYQKTFTSAATVGAVFLTAASVATVTTYDQLAAALANDAYLKVVVPADAGIAVDAGATLTVPAGKMLVVDGTLSVLGTLANNGKVLGNGAVVKVVKRVTQTGANGGPVVTTCPIEEKNVRYYKTTVADTTAKLQGTSPACTVKTGLDIVRDGAVVASTSWDSSSTVVALVCPVTSSVALNHVTSVTATYTSLKSAVDAAKGSEARCVIMLSNQEYSDTSNDFNSSVIVDCAGATLSFKPKQIRNGATLTALNGSCTVNKLTNGGARYINMSTAKVTELNANQDTYSSNIHYYDCTTISAPSTVPRGGGLFLYCGTYSCTFRANYKVYGGTYSQDPTSYLADNRLEVATSGNQYVVQLVTPKEVPPYEVGSEQFETFAEALAAVSNGGTVKLVDNVEPDGVLHVPAGRNVTLELNSFGLSGVAGIVNDGTLRIEDSSSIQSGAVGCPITNNGTLEITYGTYGGDISAAGGTVIVHGGVFTGAISAAGGDVDIRGGKFAQNPSSLLDEGYRAVSFAATGEPTYYWVGGPFRAGIVDTTISGAEKAYTVTPLESASDVALMKKWLVPNRSRSSYTDDEWRRLAELETMLTPYYSKTIEVSLTFDRDVAAQSVAGIARMSGVSSDRPLAADVAAGASEYIFTPAVTAAGYTAISYSRMLNGEFSPIGVGVKNNSAENVGTTCTICMLLRTQHRDTQNSDGTWNYTYTYEEIGRRTIVFGANGGRAMIRPAGGTAQIYQDLATALAESPRNETVYLTADVDEEVTVSRATSFVLDRNSFAFTGSIVAGDGYELTTEDLSNGQTRYTVAPAAVAQVGGEKFTSLDDALAAAQTSGEPILVLGAVPETMPEGFMSIAVNGKTLLVPKTEPEVVVQAPDEANFPDGAAATAKDKIVDAGPVAVITGTGVLDTDVCSDEAVLAALQAAATTEAERAQITAASEIRRYVSVQLTAVEVTAAAAFAGLSFDVKPMAKTFVIDAAGGVKVVVAQIPNDELRGGITFRLPLTDAFTASARIVHADDTDRLVRVAQAADGKRYVTVTATHFSIFTVYPDSHVESALTTSNVLAIKRVPGVAGAAAGTEVVAAVPWRNVALTDDVTVDRLVATGVATGDEIAAWMDGAKTYYTWRWNGTAWEPATDAKTGVTAPAASATTLRRGTAVWYKRANPSSAYSQVGGYDPATVTTAVTQGGATSAKKPANTLLINPYDGAVDLTQILGASGDQIQTLADLKVYTYKDGKWGTMQLVEVTSPFGPVKKQKFVPATGAVVVPAGQGFWYISKGGQPEIDWKEIEITAGE